MSATDTFDSSYRFKIQFWVLCNNYDDRRFAAYYNTTVKGKSNYTYRFYCKIKPGFKGDPLLVPHGNTPPTPNDSITQADTLLCYPFFTFLKYLVTFWSVSIPFFQQLT